MELLTINQNSTDNKSEGNENIIKHGRSFKRWYPYIDNGGTVIGLAGKDYVILAADTRLSLSYSIYTRYCPKISKLTDKCIIGSSGMQSDIKTLHALLQKKIQLFVLEHAHYPDIHVIARLLCVILYSRRFFPYYTFNLLAGVDEENKGVLYNYDAVGSYGEVTHSCVGSGAALIFPILDNRVEQKNQLIKNFNFNMRNDIDFVKDAITSATERDIYTGDQTEIYIVDKLGINTTTLDLKQD
ncbi:proteasome subunit beta type-1 [Plasmodium brasilianum]|uniref:Proteasome subunit beta n=2 Tax=Plasmodium (Plasmodium) TaxID=418103 RepID=A0A1A8W0A0_PLAMA|nr:proteasome subunit beta type-1, putative [Plasmodium malariae]KAI4837796.1 proteasome subunit beta type-1 [Plasmodium brasilianum]SBS86305.1 proteasome subunit beta type-1, putative [Plasmodium malariae]SBT71693.1 proteasome subunit beta type-1, putative [Plasmodium malariae]SCN44821.1 proteasome subunit beta type-1, putative [Plasmodium malariae]